MEIDSLFHDRDSAAAGCDHDLSCICKSTDRFKFHDFLWLRGCKDSAIFAISNFCNKVSLVLLCFCLFRSKNTSNDFLWFPESFIIRIDHNLGENRCDRFVDSSGDQFCTDCILKIISDISLTHGRTYRHWRKGIIRMCLTEFIHSCMDHADLRSVAVGDDNVCTILYKICNGFCSGLGSLFLFWKSCAQGFVTKSNNDSFFAHMDSSFLFNLSVKQSNSYYKRMRMELQ